MDPLTMMALLKGGGALAKYGMSRYSAGKRKYGKTAMGSELNRVKREGVLSKKYMDNVLARKNRSMSAVSGSATARAKGELIKRGMDNSISGAKVLSQPNLARMRELGYASQDLSARNEQSKVDASLDYARGKTVYDEQTDAMKRSANRELASNAVAIGTEYAMGKYAESKSDEARDLEQTRYDQARRDKIESSQPIRTALANYRKTGDADMLYATMLEEGVEEAEILAYLKMIRKDKGYGMIGAPEPNVMID